MRFVEKSGKTVDDAITAALVELGLPSDQVEIEVLSEGSKGVLGIFGMKEAKVRVTAKVESIEDEIFNDAKAAVKPEVKAAAKVEKAVEKAEKPVEKIVEKPAVKVEKPVEKKVEEKKAADKKIEEKKVDEKKVSEKKAAPVKNEQAVKTAKAPSAKPEVKKEEKAVEMPQNFVMESLVEDRLRAAKAAKEKKENAEVVENAAPIEFSEDAKKAQAAAIEFLKPVLHQMGIEAEITGKMEEEDVLCLDIAGENLGMIIGKRGNTLDSLQYLTVLVANKATEEHIKIKLDAENYREKRKETLEKLAINLAKKARKTNRRVALEPMNPYERRIIHSALQSFNGVETHSEGEEPFRKVIISPVKGNYHRR